jgi:polycomb protein EED
VTNKNLVPPLPSSESMVKTTLGCEPVVGSLTPSRKRDYRVTNRLQEGKRPIYAVVFNFIDSRYFNVFATVGGNRVSCLFIFYII